MGSATDIPVEDKSIDAVISFETIEHIPDYEKFLEDVKRVLKDDGLFIVSTPNDKEFPEGADFHVHEFKQSELEDLLAKYFSNIKTYYQSTWLYNALLDDKSVSTEIVAEVLTLNTAPVEPKQAIYFLILCSNSKISDHLPPVGAISERWTTKAMLEHNTKMEKYIKDTMAHYEGILEKKDEEIQKLYKIKTEHETLKTEISGLAEEPVGDWSKKLEDILARTKLKKGKP